MRSEKAGRVRTCRIDTEGLRAAERWLAGQRTTWERRLERLDEVLTEAPTDSREAAAPPGATAPPAEPHRTDQENR